MRVCQLSLLCLIIAGCAKSGGSSPLPPTGYAAGGSAPAIAQPKEETVFSFNYYDGGTPWCTLLAVNGELYGTTAIGGTEGGGTIFKMTRSGQESTLANLSDDFGTSVAGLITLHGWLYGTASALYGSRGGQAFKIGKSGQTGWFSEIGRVPQGRMVALNGVLYGTTYGGGAYSDGTVFAITTSGQPRALYTFKGSPDGNNPISDLVVLNGKLYGTTTNGGSRGGSGTVFEVDTSGNERVVYSFSSDGKDGVQPQGALAVANGKIYGATPFGGRGQFGGTVFEVTVGGRERVLHRFNCETGACGPSGGVIAENGVLYGTTAASAQQVQVMVARSSS